MFRTLLLGKVKTPDKFPPDQLNVPTTVPPKAAWSPQETAGAGERVAVGKEVTGKIEVRAASRDKVAAAARAPALDAQRPTLHADCAGVVEHDIAIQHSGRWLPDLRNVPKLSKRVGPPL